MEFLPSADRLIVSMSDIEMGAGGLWDDFPQTAWLASVLRRYNEAPYAHLPIDLVFNGDTFDLLKTPYRGGTPHLVDARIATEKMASVIAAHHPFFAGVRDFLAHPRAPRRVLFVVGNHDVELLFPEVQAQIRDAIGDAGPVGFPGLSVDIGRVHIEHGQQADPMFRMDEPLFVEHDGKQVLRLSWGAVAILEVALPMRPFFYHHDRLKPRDELFRLLPEARELIVNAFFAYWTRDFWRSVLRRDDPVKHLSWTMLREVAYRFGTQSATIDVTGHFLSQMRHSDRYDLYLYGHEHEGGFWTHGGRRVIRTGAFRNEFALEQDGTIQRPISNLWAEVFMQGDRPVDSRLVEAPAPPCPRDYVPTSIFTVLDEVRARLGTARERQHAAEAQEAQVAQESRR